MGFDLFYETDAEVWVSAFEVDHPETDTGIPLDDMYGWFANSIGAGKRSRDDEVKALQDRIDLLERFIVQTRGSLDTVNEETIDAVREDFATLLGVIADYAQTIRRGNGSAANFEYQFRHAEYRAKLAKENLRKMAHQAFQLILAVGSVVDRTHNQVNPEDLEWLRDQLSVLQGYQQIATLVDGEISGEVSPMNIFHGTGEA